MRLAEDAGWTHDPPPTGEHPYTPGMPTYEFRCRACGTTFTEARPMAASMAPATCPDGHGDTVRLLDVAGVARASASAPAPAAAGGGGGCCGGGCCGG